MPHIPTSFQSFFSILSPAVAIKMKCQVKIRGPYFGWL
jgi:hypothetical protein